MKRTLLILALLCASPLFAQQQIPITGGVVTADLSSGVTSFKVNLNQNVSSVVLTGQHPGSGGNTVICTLFFVQDATGGWTVTFGGNITGGFAVNATPLFTTVEQFAFDFTSNTWYVINAGSAGASGISGSGTANDIAMFTGPFSIGNGPINVAGGVTSSSNPFSQPASLFNCVNSASGTTNGLLVTRDASGNCINLPAAQTTKIVGVVYTGGGTSGVALICKIGTCPVTLDNTSVIDDCIIAASSGAQGHDAGPTCPTGVQQLGIAQSVNAGTGTAANVDVFISDIQSGPSGPVQTLQVNGVTLAGTLDNFNATTPAAQANNQNLVFQTDNATPTSNVSVEVPLATTGQLGLIELARDLCGTDVAPIVCGIQQIPVTFTSPAANDVICFPTSSTLANCKQGVPIRTVSGNSDAILSTDRVSDVRYTASSGATAVSLTQAGTGAFTNNITMVVTNAQGTGAVTITPATSTINGASTLVIPAGNYCFIYSDNSNYFANCGQTGGGSSITGSGTNNTMTKWTGAASIGNSSATDDGTNPTRTPNGLNTAANGNYDEWTVDTGGVTANKLACRSSNNKAQICATSTTQGVLGVALTTQTSGQTVQVCWAAHCSVIPSNNTTSGHWLIPSTSVAGDVDDTGSTVQPTGTQTFLAETTVTAPAVVATTILSPDAVAAASGGKPFTLEVNGTVTGIVANLNSSTPAPGAGFLAVTPAASTSGNTTSIINKVAISGNTSTVATVGTMSGSAGAITCDDGNKNVTTSSCAASASQIPSSIRTRGLVFSYGDPGGSAITAGSTATDYMTVPFACTISAYNILVDAGTVTIKFWKVATGTAIPTSGNSISTSGVSISSGTAIHSTTVTDFTTTAVSANDIIAMNVSTVATAKFVSATLECDQ